MSIPETLLAAVCLLVTCSRDRRHGRRLAGRSQRKNRAAAEFTVTAQARRGIGSSPAARISLERQNTLLSA